MDGYNCQRQMRPTRKRLLRRPFGLLAMTLECIQDSDFVCFVPFVCLWNFLIFCAPFLKMKKNKGIQKTRCVFRGFRAFRVFLFRNFLFLHDYGFDLVYHVLKLIHSWPLINSGPVWFTIEVIAILLSPVGRPK